MRIYAIAALTLIATDVHAQAQCVKQFVDKCKEYESAAENFRGSGAAAAAGAAEVQRAMQSGFEEQAAAWATVKTKCGEIKKGCQQMCASSREQCLSELDPITQRAVTQELTNTNQARETAGQTDYTDDMGAHDRKIAQAKMAAENGAQVEQTGGQNYSSVERICPSEGNCYGANGTNFRDLPNGQVTITPLGGGAYSTFTPGGAKLKANGLPGY